MFNETCADDALSDALRSNLTRLIAYAKSADPDLQRQVAEKLANEAVKRECHGRLDVFRYFCGVLRQTSNTGGVHRQPPCTLVRGAASDVQNSSAYVITCHSGAGPTKTFYVAFQK